MWDRQPPVKEPVMSSPEDVDKLSVPDPTKECRMPVVIKATEILSEKVKEEQLPILVGIVSPFMIAGQVRGVDHFMIEIIKKPDWVHKIVDICTKTCIDFVKLVEDAGASAITVVDATSSPDLISPKHYDIFSNPYVEEMIKNLKNSRVSTILHICGHTKPILGRMASVGARVVSIDSCVDMRDLKEAVNESVRQQVM